MKGLMILADHFEDAEAICTIDFIRRAGIECDLVSIKNDLCVVSQSNIKMICDKLYADISLTDYNFLIIPGGKAVFETHLNSLVTNEVVTYFKNHHLLIGAICAAPLVLGKNDLLKNKKFVCFPGCETSIDGIFDGSIKAVTTDNIITSKACGTSFDFGYEIVKYLVSEDLAEKVKASIYYH